jgi:leucyl aminopeptidase
VIAADKKKTEGRVAMQIFTTTSNAARRSAGCVIVGVYANGKLGQGAEMVDSASKGQLTRLVKAGDISGRPGTTMMLTDLNGVRAQRVLVVGLGKVSEFDVAKFRQAIATATTLIKHSQIREIVSYLSLEPVANIGPYYLARYTIESIGNVLYRFHESKSGRKPKAPALRKIGLAGTSRSDGNKLLRGAEHGTAIVEGMSLAKDLGNLPPNVCTPAYLARTAQKIARTTKNLTTRVINETEIRRLGMHSFLSVTSGTTLPAKLIVMQYKGAGKERPIVLVGKGITFDAGGISLKPGPGMDEMKFDMCGAAAVIATMAVVSSLGLPVNLTVVVPACENLPSGTATRPGDIVTSMSGKTIEILNTDAEGRLILCDALTFARRFKPAVVLDVATLTGACVIALGHHRTAVMSRSDKLANEITTAGIAADDLGWQMPLADEYERQLNSNFADFANIGGREGGAITAACFLGKFTEGLDWAHLDIAGTAWRSGKAKGSTGRPVPLLTEFILQRAGATP